MVKCIFKFNLNLYLIIMKQIKLLTLLFISIAFFSCSSDDDSITANAPTLETQIVSNLSAPQTGGQGQPIGGEFSKFDFATGQATSSDTEWDVAFRGTTIIVNGGQSSGLTDEPERTGDAAVYIATGTLENINTVLPESLEQDSGSGLAIPTGSDNGWYNYSGPPTFIITPIAGRVLVFRTRDGKYAKMEILSYYKDAPDVPDAFVNESRYFTFNFVYQPDGSITNF
jgi:hypothetical protein